MRIFTYIILAIILIIGVSFAGLNSTEVTINYYVGKHSMPVSLVVVLSLVFGCFIGWLIGFFMYLKLKAQNFKLKNRIKVAEKEVNNLRTMPLQDNR